MCLVSNWSRVTSHCGKIKIAIHLPELRVKTEKKELMFMMSSCACPYNWSQVSTDQKAMFIQLIIHWTHYLFSDWLKTNFEISKSVPVTSSSCKLYRSFLSCHVWPQCMISKVNHVKFAHFVLLAVIEEVKTGPPCFFFIQWLQCN